MMTEKFWNMVFTINKIFLPFSGKFSQKKKNYLLGVQTNLNKLNLMMMFNFYVFDRKYFFRANLVHNYQIKMKLGDGDVLFF